jgi:signal transduction histidine kinase
MVTRIHSAAIQFVTAFWNRRGSLRLRLIMAAVVSSMIAVAVAGTGIVILANARIERRVVTMLQGQLDQLTAHFDLVDGEPQVTADLADPRFDKPFSGLYWQVSEDGQPKIRSRSLWDQVLKTSGVAIETAEGSGFQVPGPRDQLLIVVSRDVTIGHQPARSFVLEVAVDRSNVDQIIQDYAIETASFLGALVIFLAAASWIQVAVGLRPLDGLREMVFAVRGGRSERLAGTFPDEVIPLVEELNALIDAQTQTIERARARAGDLAHGLKTPLAVISSETRQMRENGQHASADVIEAEIETMSRFIERQLARARIMSLQRHGRRIEMNTLVKRLVRTMRRLPRGTEVDFEIDVPGGIGVDLQSEDADEIFGNLLDNARKFATSHVMITVRQEDKLVHIQVADDGPGVPEGRRESVLLRGQRLDETIQGSGLGLSIVDDLVSSYRGKLRLDETPGGGLTVDVFLPASTEATATA